MLTDVAAGAGAMQTFHLDGAVADVEAVRVSVAVVAAVAAAAVVVVAAVAVVADCESVVVVVVLVRVIVTNAAYLDHDYYYCSLSIVG